MKEPDTDSLSLLLGLNNTRQLLQFLALILHSDSVECVHNQSITAFLRAVLGRLSDERCGSSHRRFLLDALLTCATLCSRLESPSEPNDIDNLWNVGMFWGIAMDTDITDIVSVCRWSLPNR